MRIARAVLCLVVFSLAASSGYAGDLSQRFRAENPGQASKLRVSDPLVADTLQAGGARLVADYGSFQVFEASAATATELAADGLDNVTYENNIELHAGWVDTRNAVAQQARTRAAAFGGKRLHLVQFAGPVKAEWHRALTKTGVRIVDYIPHNAYLVYGDAAALQAVQQMAGNQPAVQFQGAFLNADKIHPTARAAAGKRKAAASPEGLYQIQMVADAEANADTLAVIDALKLAPIVRQNISEQYRSVVVKLSPDVLDGLSAQPDIISIWPYATPRKFDERQGMILAGNLSGNGPSGAGYLAWLAGKGFTQSQFDSSALVVDVTDSGLDNGTTNVNHFALFRGGTTADVRRVRYVRLEGTPNSGSTLQGCDGHGNLNAHIIGGYVSLTNFPHTDSAGYRYGLGIAPFVKVGSSVIFDSSEFTSPDYEDLASRAYRDGARVSGNSWGADTAGGYDVDAQQYDAIVRDAQQTGAAVPAAGNQEMTFVFAAGNAGSGTQTVGSPGTAKNVITVGAAENVHSHAITNGGNSATGADGCDTPDSEANSANDVATFSSRGPCSDSRKKPEIMAPGTHVTGGVGQNVKTMSGNGTSVTCFDGTGVCALPGGGTVGSTNNFFPLGQKWYSTSSGTSHSTPAVAGGAALVYQWFLNTFASAPSPAMIKAFLMNAARYMNGTGANDTLYSNNQGMGMMNLGTAFDGTPRVLRDQLTNDTFTASGQSRTFTGTIVSNSKPVRITLTWTDAPGSTSGNAYKNNLDLTVVINGTTYRGNVFSGANSIAGGSADVRNNAESVFLPAGTTGTVAITVGATSINSDGVPNYGGSLDQDYALVAYNVSETQAPSLAAAGAQITAEGCGAGNGSLDPGEAVTVKFALRNVGTANTTNVVATLLATGGVSAPGPAQSYGALAAGGAPVTNAYAFIANGICGGTVTATLALVDGATALGTASYTFTLGGSTVITVTNSNTAAITINDNAAATPYPSSINVSGLAGSVSKVTVTLQGFSHAYPSDVDVVLVSPGGQKVGLLGGAGGETSVNGLTLAFDDSAGGQVGDPITSGTWQPSGSVASSLPGAAPAAPYGTALADFIGSTPNGTWSLYVADGAASDTGVIASGWKLAITAGEPLCCGSNKPPVLAAIGDKSVIVSNTLTFAITATDSADNDPITLVASNLPGDATFGVTNGNGTFTWTNASPTGTYSVVFNASDKDGFDEETISVIVGSTPDLTATNYIVNFEGAGETKASYASGNVTLSGLSWTLGETLIGTTSGSDRFNGIRSARMRNSTSSLTMLADLSSGATNISFYHAKYGADANAILALDYSTDSGGSWINAGTVTVSSTTLTLYSTNVNVTGNIRIRIRKTSTSSDSNRASVDDIQISSGGSGSGGGSQTPPVFSPISAQSTLVSNSLQFTVTATPTDGDTVTLTASNLPAGAVFGSTNELGSFLWASATPIGVYTSRFYATDNDGTVTQTVIITVDVLSGEGSMETFSNLNASATTYNSGSYVGDNGITWNYSGARKPAATYFIDGQSIGFGESGSNQRQVYSQTIPGGVGSLSVKYLKYFTGAGTRSFDIYVNTQLVGSVSDANNVSVQTQSIAGINIPSNVVIKIVGTGGKQFIIDSLAWTGFSGGAPTPGPGIAVTTVNQTVSFAITNLPVGGTSSNLAGFISWTNSQGGAVGTIPAATGWLITDLALNVGTNLITVRGTNSVGAASASVTLIRESSDSDMDGIEDAWELSFFPSLTNLSATSDWDMDGFLDVDEYRAGSIPTNSSSLLEATTTAPSSAGGFVVTWQSASNKSYTLARSTNLMAGFVGIASNIPAFYPLNTYTDAVNTNASSVYRVELE